MSKSSQGAVGKRFSCPGCDALLRFKRIPTRLVHTCPNCRRLLRLSDKMAVLEKGDDLQAVIDEFVSREQAPPPKVAYEEDPRLDEVVTNESGVWQFNQPWPVHITDVLYQRIEVIPNKFNLQGNMLQRRQLLSGFHRRVTLARTGEIEEIAVTGHWRNQIDREEYAGILGALPHPLVRELNRFPISTIYIGRINCALWERRNNEEYIEMHVDIAKSAEEQHKRRVRMIK